jgi:7,8-dihydropterin-6-yl-methyl-4-(beta-D-ribofuranosyl)aminobenzene 5'-phosphate synthase
VLEANAAALDVSAAEVSAVVISHLHPDHVGGIRAQLRNSFAVPDALRLPYAVPAFVPVDMTHSTADVTVVSAPQVVAAGVAVLPPLNRMLFWLGRVAERALVVNVRGFGLVLVSGCGHPRIEGTMAACEQALDLPIQAVVGGLHLPVHPLGTRCYPRRCSAVRTGLGSRSAKPTPAPPSR